MNEIDDRCSEIEGRGDTTEQREGRLLLVGHVELVQELDGRHAEGQRGAGDEADGVGGCARAGGIGRDEGFEGCPRGGAGLSADALCSFDDG